MTARHTIKTALVAAGIAVATLAAFDPTQARAEEVTLTMAVPDWPPTVQRLRPPAAAKRRLQRLAAAFAARPEGGG